MTNSTDNGSSSQVANAPLVDVRKSYSKYFNTIDINFNLAAARAQSNNLDAIMSNNHFGEEE